jgi:hypothetical protein
LSSPLPHGDGTAVIHEGHEERPFPVPLLHLGSGMAVHDWETPQIAESDIFMAFLLARTTVSRWLGHPLTGSVRCQEPWRR